MRKSIRTVFLYQSTVESLLDKGEPTATEFKQYLSNYAQSEGSSSKAPVKYSPQDARSGQSYVSRKAPSKNVSQCLEKCSYGSTIKMNTARLRKNRTRKGRVLMFNTRCERCSQSTAQRQILRNLDCLADDAEGAECMD